MEKRSESAFATRRPERRHLRIFASDPMSGRRGTFRITIDIENEKLQSGPKGRLVEVWDYDPVNDVYYAPVDLDDPNHLMEDGLSPNESDPRFHQQMVYAVTMRVIETASRALGRPLTFYRGSKTPKLRIFPHGFAGENAYFDPDSNALVFGYFPAREENVGANIPRQLVYTCLSHDIIAHEMTHAIVHRLRRYFIEPTNPDVHAFHEGFSDIVAILVKFTYRDLVADLVRTTNGRLWEVDALVELAQQFGLARGTGQALRTAYSSNEPDPKLYTDTKQAHARGAILLGAVFDGFFVAYRSRIESLLRIGDGGLIAGGGLHPDLVKRIAEEVAALADRLLRMCFRAFDYMPPIDVTFSDFLRAIVTSDYTLDPEDKDELRFHIIEGFRRRGIYPRNVKSLAEESLLWPEGKSGLRPLNAAGLKLAQSFLGVSALASDVLRRNRSGADMGALTKFQRVEMAVSTSETDSLRDDDDPGGLDADLKRLQKKMAPMLHTYAKRYVHLLGLDPSISFPISIAGFNAIQREGRNGRLQIEFVVQIVQTNAENLDAQGGLPLRAGATIVFSAEGKPLYVISKPMPGAKLGNADLVSHATVREKDLNKTIQWMDEADPRMAFADPVYKKNRMKMRAAFRAMHEGHS